MKILLTGFIAFALWSALSTYIYVCKIKELCFEPIALHIDKIISTDSTDSAKMIKLKVKVMIPSDLVINFDFDKSNFIPDSKSNKYFSSGDSFLMQNDNSRLRITGHTDAIGTETYNLALGLRRAEALRQYFESKGILAEKILIVSKGEKEPVSANSTIAGRASNRRAVITINK